MGESDIINLSKLKNKINSADYPDPQYWLDTFRVKEQVYDNLSIPSQQDKYIEKLLRIKTRQINRNNDYKIIIMPKSVIFELICEMKVEEETMQMIDNYLEN